MEKQLNWAVLGTGVIANEMAATLQKMGKRLAAIIALREEEEMNGEASLTDLLSSISG